MNPQQRIWVAIAAVLVFASGALGWWFYPREDRQVAEIRALGQKLFSEENQNLSNEERDQLRRDLREKARDLTEEQRDALREDMEKRFDERLDEFFKLPVDQRVAYLDKQIDEWEKRRAEWAKRAQARGNRKDGSPRGQRGGGGGGEGGGNRGQRQGGPGGGRSTEQRQQRSRDRLDKSTPEQRAKRAEYFRALDQRRQERGLPGPGGGRFGR